MRRRNAIKPRRMRRPPRGKSAKVLALGPLPKPVFHPREPEVKYHRIWP